jgi:hypothetical protein
MGGAGGGGQELLVDTAAVTGGGRGRRRRAAKAVAEGEEQCQNGVWCVLYSTLLGKASKIREDRSFFSESKLCTPATNLSPSPLSTLHDKFDNEKELCNMTDIDFVQLSQLFQLGIIFLHGGMLPIFDALVYLSCHHHNL